MAPWQTRLFVTYVHAYLANGKAAANLLPIFNRWKAYLGANSWSIPLKIQFRVAEARLSHTLGNHAAAAQALDEALELVAATGYVRFVLDHLEVLRPLLLRSRHPVVERVLGEAVHSRPQVTEPELSPVELRVLRLSALDLTRKEIADRLIVSENTVKTHLRHIYAKLGAPTRAGALAKADQLGLLKRRG